jgi:serine/threonine protein kinase
MSNMAPHLSHTKVFEEPYLFNREAQILADLHQRGAPVPRILAMDHVAKSITMDHDGTSLENVIESLSQSPAAHKAWTHRNLGALVKTVATVADHGVFHLDLASRNFLVSQSDNGDPQIKLIDFGLALSIRLPLQKPLWVIPDPKLHHPLLLHAMADDWQQFFRDSARAAAIYRERGLPIPSYFVGTAFDIPLEAYQSYWPQTVNADALKDRWCLVCHSFSDFLGELVGRLMLPEIEQKFLLSYAQTLRNLEHDSLAKERLLKLPIALAQTGGTPRPGMFTKPEATSQGNNSHATQDALGPWAWLLRPTALLVLLANYAYIDDQYKTHQIVLSDLGFYASLLALVAGGLGGLSVLSARLWPLFVFSLLAIGTTQVWFGFEMASQGLGLGTSFAVGLGVFLGLGLAKMATPKPQTSAQAIPAWPKR